MYNDCYATCGVGNNKCKNKYCSANPNYSAPVPKQKAKQGAGKPCKKKQASIPKYNSFDAELFSRLTRNTTITATKQVEYFIRKIYNFVVLYEIVKGSIAYAYY